MEVSALSGDIKGESRGLSNSKNRPPWALRGPGFHAELTSVLQHFRKMPKQNFSVFFGNIRPCVTYKDSTCLPHRSHMALGA